VVKLAHRLSKRGGRRSAWWLVLGSGIETGAPTGPWELVSSHAASSDRAGDLLTKTGLSDARFRTRREALRALEAAIHAESYELFPPEQLIRIDNQIWETRDGQYRVERNYQLNAWEIRHQGRFISHVPRSLIIAADIIGQHRIALRDQKVRRDNVETCAV